MKTINSDQGTRRSSQIANTWNLQSNADGQSEIVKESWRKGGIRRNKFPSRIHIRVASKDAGTLGRT
jgi:hypothetical protein